MKVIFLLYVFSVGIGLAQAPVGTIAGLVRDASGAAVDGAKIKEIGRAHV